MPARSPATLEVVGEWWTLLIVRDAFLGVTRFDDWQRRLGIARNVLAARLDALVEAGVLERRQYQEHPPRDEYVLTRKGRDLGPVLDAMRVWGDRCEPTPDGPPALLVHDACGEVTRRGPGTLRALRRAPAPGTSTSTPGPAARTPSSSRRPPGGLTLGLSAGAGTATRWRRPG